MTATTLALMQGCTHKNLNDSPDFIGRPLVSVTYDWNTTESFLPEGMANLFYQTSSASGSYWRSDFRPEGGTVRMPAGEYNAITFNNDTENVLFSDIDNFSELTFSTSPIDIGNIPDDMLPFPPQRLFRQPDRMWSDTKTSIEIKSAILRDTVCFNPQRITRDYHIEMSDIENLKSALRYYAVISDLASSYLPASQESSGETVSMGGFMSPIDATTLSSTVTSFGMSEESTHSRLAVYMWLADGQHKVYHYDVTDQIVNAPDPMNVEIRVKGPSLPEITPGEGEGGSGGGLDVGVDDWDIIDIEL